LSGGEVVDLAVSRFADVVGDDLHQCPVVGRSLEKSYLAVE